VKVEAGSYRIHNPLDEIHRVSRLRENLTSGSDGEGLETDLMVPRQSFTRQLFFKWIKQNLKIKSFLGTSKNAVMTQIWIAIVTLLLLAYYKFRAKLTHGLSQILKLLQLNLFSRRNVWQLFDPGPTKHMLPNCEQLSLNFNNL
jgi:putative transposase